MYREYLPFFIILLFFILFGRSDELIFLTNLLLNYLLFFFYLYAKGQGQGVT